MIEIKGEYTTAEVRGDREMFDEVFFEQVQEIVDHEAFTNDIVIQPDGHAGAGAVIGFTMSIGDKLTPNVVGSDIGCGVTAARIGNPDGFEIRGDEREYWEDVDEEIRSAVPMGLGQTHSDPDYHIVNNFPWKQCQTNRIAFDYEFEEDVEYGREYLMDLCKRVGLDVNDVIASMGTLGSGNHFFEISRSEETGEYWMVVHSGSRCVGGAVSGYWQDKATDMLEGERVLEELEKYDWMWDYVKFDRNTPSEEVRQWVLGGKGESFYDMEKIRQDFDGEEIEETRQTMKSVIPDTDRNQELDYLEGEAKEEYITDMIFAQQYARENRRQMILNACDALGVEIKETIDSIHNYIDFRDGVIRKGATRAHEDQKLIIPFNMADGAVICRGRGNESFNNSAPHGAGRRGSRRWAYDEFDVEQFEEELSDVHNMNDSEEVLDEIPSAYKDAEDILEYLQETASVEETLTPVLNMKGE